MAKIVSFEKVTKSRTGNISETVCGFAKVEIDGEQLLALDTYGSSDRAVPGKISQRLHLSRDAAKELKSILEQAFPGI